MKLSHIKVRQTVFARLTTNKDRQKNKNIGATGTEEERELNYWIAAADWCYECHCLHFPCLLLESQQQRRKSDSSLPSSHRAIKLCEWINNTILIWRTLEFETITQHITGVGATSLNLKLLIQKFYAEVRNKLPVFRPAINPLNDSTKLWKTWTCHLDPRTVIIPRTNCFWVITSKALW